MIDVSRMTVEELRKLKKDVEKELSRRHKEKEDEKCSCWTCHHCFFDKNAHKSYPKSSDYRGDYKCMAWSKKGRIIPTKHKAPVWCPKEPTVADVFDSLPEKEKEKMCKEIATAITVGEVWESIDYEYRKILSAFIEKVGNKEEVNESTKRSIRNLLDNVLTKDQKRVVYFMVGKACEKWKEKGE